MTTLKSLPSSYTKMTGGAMDTLSDIGSKLKLNFAANILRQGANYLQR